MIDNPKQGPGRAKPSYRFAPPCSVVWMNEALRGGALKYGAFNWAETGVAASDYYDSMNRHLDLWYTGEDIDEESGIHHLAHVMAGAAIILDCWRLKKLLDDRPHTAKVGFSFKEITERIADDANIGKGESSGSSGGTVGE